MKKTAKSIIGKFIGGIAMSAMVCQVGFAQVTDPNPDQDQTQTQDQNNTMQDRDDYSQRTQQDLQTRYPDWDQQSVQWDTTGNEYSASYNMNDNEYKARYDAEGNWLETMERREWDENNAPDNLKAGLNDNAYENYEVDSYWEITESDSTRGRNTGYYFDLKDKEGNTKNLRMDSDGKIVDDNDYNDPR